MLQAKLKNDPDTVVVKKTARDSPKLKAIKDVIKATVVYDPKGRITMSEVVKKLQKIADGLSFLHTILICNTSC